MTIDSYYEEHIDRLCRKLSKQLGLLKHISPYLKKQQRELYFNSVIKPTMMYGSVIWDNCNAECFQRVLKLQKRAARIILDAEKMAPSIVMFNTLNWLPFTKESLIKRIMLAYKRVNSAYNTPSYLNSLLARNSDRHSRNTRYSNLNMLCPIYNRKTEGGRTFTVRTIIDRNKLDLNVRSIHSAFSFRRSIYKQFLDDQKCANRLQC